MKTISKISFAILALGFVTVANVHAEEVMTVDEKLEAFRDGKAGVYGVSPATDIGNVIHHENGEKKKMNCADMPHKGMKMDMKDCEKTEKAK